uniref:Putative secreted protein n=1 Tax=Anopheles darlingi TaxID=43151 RepID=A0A2M4DAP3_ANODA
MHLFRIRFVRTVVCVPMFIPSFRSRRNMEPYKTSKQPKRIETTDFHSSSPNKRSGDSFPSFSSIASRHFTL